MAASGKEFGQVRIKWRGGQVTSEIKKIIAPRLKRVGSELRNHIVRKISQGKTRTQGPSKPGFPPHIDTGHLRKNIFWELLQGGLTVRVGTTVDYGLDLEQGTRNVAPRPYLRVSLTEMTPKIKRLLAGKYKKG